MPPYLAKQAGRSEMRYDPAEDLDVVGVEALARWQHPERGQLPPGDFIPMAEHTGLIRPLTLEVLRMATRQLRAWQEDGFELSLAVNPSLANLLDNRLVDDVAGILADADMPADRLVLEITESTIMGDPVRTIAILEKLAATGIKLSIDD